MNSPFGAAVYVSYAWGDQASVDAVEELKARFSETFITFKPDKYTLQAGDDFGEFVQEIGRANCVIILFSKAYFKSFYCMLELARIVEHSQNKDAKTEDGLKQRIIGIQLSELNISYIHKLDVEQALENTNDDIEFGTGEQCLAEMSRISLQKVPYKSEPEQKLILKHFDCFHEVFGQHLNHTVIDDACWEELITKARITHIQHLSRHPLFKEAANCLCKDSCLALQAKLEQLPLGGVTLSTNEDKISALLTLPLDKLTDTLNAILVENSGLKSRINLLVRKLLPFYCQLEHVAQVEQAITARKLQTEQLDSYPVPYALDISVENMMSAIDQRDAHFFTRPISTRNSKPQLIVDPKYCLFLSPESGEDQRTTYIEDTKSDLLNGMGLLNLSEPSTRLHKVRSFLSQEMLGEDDSEVSNEEIHEALIEQSPQEEYEQKKVPHRYFIIPNKISEQDRAEWRELAQEIHKISSQLVVFSLDNKREKKKQERQLFKKVSYLITEDGE